MDVAVIGGGYVGLVSGTCLAAKGHRVRIVELNEAKVAQIEAGKSPIHEEGLDDLLTQHIGKNLSATSDLSAAVKASDLTLIAVGTPFNGDKIDLSQIEAASTAIGNVLKTTDKYHVVVVKSTVVPGTTDELVLPALEKASGKKCGADFGVGMNPEFLREGNAVEDFMNPDRIVIGANDAKSLKIIESLYDAFDSTDKVGTNTTTAEMIKYTSNALLATLISFANEVGNICENVKGVDTKEVFDGVHLDKRFSPIMPDGSRVSPQSNTYLQTGCGFGGSCFPKDVSALMAFAAEKSVTTHVLDAVMQTNKVQPNKLIDLLGKHHSDFKNLKVTVLGLAFKPGTDDIRESASLPVVKHLVDAGAVVTVFDPHAMQVARETEFSQYSTIHYAENVEAATVGADAIIVATSWPEFYDVPALINNMPEKPVLIDGRRQFSPDSVQRYEGVGRGPFI